MGTMSTALYTQFERNVNVQWLVQNHIILIHSRGPVTLEQREWAYAQIVAMIHSCATSAIHLINETHQTSSLSIFNCPRPLVIHPRRGWWIHIGRTPESRLTWASRTMARLIYSRYTESESLYRALVTLQALDSALPSLSSLLQWLASPPVG